MSVAFCFDCKKLTSGGNDQTIKLWKIIRNTKIYALKGKPETIFPMSLSIYSKILACSLLNGSIIL